mgnify:CR=1 FL=1
MSFLSTSGLGPRVVLGQLVGSAVATHLNHTGFACSGKVKYFHFHERFFSNLVGQEGPIGITLAQLEMPQKFYPN